MGRPQGEFEVKTIPSDIQINSFASDEKKYVWVVVAESKEGGFRFEESTDTGDYKSVNSRIVARLANWCASEEPSGVGEAHPAKDQEQAK
jgi:hypothetical protein